MRELDAYPLRPEKPFGLTSQGDYGPRRNPVTKEYGFHRGMDGGGWDEDWIACWGGTLWANPFGSAFGVSRVLVNAEGHAAHYCHGVRGSVPDVGTEVEAGRKIGEVGDTGNTTGPHLHFGLFERAEIFKDYDTSVDPKPYLEGVRSLNDADRVWIKAAIVDEREVLYRAVVEQFGKQIEALGIGVREIVQALGDGLNSSGGHIPNDAAWNARLAAYNLKKINQKLGIP